MNMITVSWPIFDQNLLVHGLSIRGGLSWFSPTVLCLPFLSLPRQSFPGKRLRGSLRAPWNVCPFPRVDPRIAGPVLRRNTPPPSYNPMSLRCKPDMCVYYEQVVVTRVLDKPPPSRP